MFEWLRKLFRPTVEDIMEKEKRQAEKLYNKTCKNLVAWARNPVGSEVFTYVGSALNNRVEEHLLDKLRNNVFTKYNCTCRFTRDGFLVICTKWDTDKLILKENI